MSCVACISPQNPRLVIFSSELKQATFLLRAPRHNMAGFTLSAPLQTSLYVCDACRQSLRPWRIARSVSTRLSSTHASSNIRSTTARQISRVQQPQCRNIALPSSIRPIVQNASRAHPYSTAATTVASHSGVAALRHRRLISLSGPDAAKFLQGLITNNVDQSRETPFYAAFLDARGRVLWDVFIWTWPELIAGKGHWACYIEVDEQEVDALKKHLKRHKLRSKIKVEDVGQDGKEGMRIWAAWGSAVEKVNRNVIAALSDPTAPDGYLSRYLASALEQNITQEVENVDADEYHKQRYRCGIPEGPHEILREGSLPMECNIDLSQGIDFKKGCYVGQELTIRTKHTGVVRKRILPIVLDETAPSSAPPEQGTDIKQLDENGCMKKGRAVGKYMAGIGHVGLALCRLENMTCMKISAEGGSWKPGVEFGVENSNGDVVRVKPILHDWFVLRERQLWDKNRTRI